MVRSLILNPLTWRIGRTAPDSAGSMYLIACQALLCSVIISRLHLQSKNVRCCRACLGLTITNDASHQQVRPVHHRPEGDGERIAQLSAFVDCAWRFRIDMAARRNPSASVLLLPWMDLVPRKASGHRESRNQVSQALVVDAVRVGVKLCQRPLDPERRQHSRRAMTGTDDDNRVHVMPLHQQIDVGPDEDQPRARTPMTWVKTSVNV